MWHGMRRNLAMAKRYKYILHLFQMNNPFTITSSSTTNDDGDDDDTGWEWEKDVCGVCTGKIEKAELTQSWSYDIWKKSLLLCSKPLFEHIFENLFYLYFPPPQLPLILFLTTLTHSICFISFFLSLLHCARWNIFQKLTFNLENQFCWNCTIFYLKKSFRDLRDIFRRNFISFCFVSNIFHVQLFSSARNNKLTFHNSKSHPLQSKYPSINQSLVI